MGIKDVVIATRDDLRGIFFENIDDLVKDRVIKGHMVSMLVDFVDKRQLTLGEEKADSVAVNDLFEEEEYYGLINRGDAYLFLCGWFPELITNNRKSYLGLDFYMEKGIDSYQFALSLIHQKKASEKTEVPYKMAANFGSNVGALVNLKTRIIGQISINLKTISEFEKLGIRNFESAKNVEDILVNASVYGKREDSMMERMAKSGIYVVK